MSRFTKPLRVSPVPPNGAEWCLIEPFGYDVTIEGSGKTVEVPRGFVTDFASVPPGGRWLLPKWGPYGNAAVIHDLLYWEQTFLGEKISRERADGIMLEAMEDLEVPWWKSWLIHKALRLGGWVAWETNRLNRKSGFRRIIDLEELKPGYEHNRPGLLKEVAAKFREPEPTLGLARFSGELAKVVAPALLERALRPPHAEEPSEAGERSADALLAAELHADGLREALTALANATTRLAELESKRSEIVSRIEKLEKAKPPGEAPERGVDELPAESQERREKHERESLAYQDRPQPSVIRRELKEARTALAEATMRLANLEGQRSEIVSRIEKLEKAKPPGEAPKQGVDELPDEFQERREKHERERLAYQDRPQLSVIRSDWDKQLAGIAEATRDIERCEREIEHARRDAIVAALVGLAEATEKELKKDPSVGFTLALATDRIHALLEPTLLAPIQEEMEGVEAAKSARDVIEEVGKLVGPWLEEPDRQGEVVSGFLSAADTVRPRYERNLDLLTSIRKRLDDLPERGKATRCLEEIQELLAPAGVQVAKIWGLLEKTQQLAKSVEEVRGDLRFAGVGAMERELESAGLPQVLQAWALLSQGNGATDIETTERTVLAARTEGLRLRIAGQVAARVGFTFVSGGEDGTIEKDESLERDASLKRMAFVERIATSRLLVDEAEKLLEDDAAMRFLVKRRALEQRAAKRASRERRALWWVLLPLAPAIWLLLRGSVKSLREFFGIGADGDAPPAPPIYRELGALARTVLPWAGYAYGVLALSSVGLLLSQFRLVPAEGAHPWILGFAGANFLGCCLYLVWQGRSIRLPASAPVGPTRQLLIGAPPDIKYQENWGGPDSRVRRPGRGRDGTNRR